MGYSLCIVATFEYTENGLIYRVLAFFLVNFCIEHFECVSRDVFGMF